jgi:prolyl-tRNA editing enzyme YbaK/EbsC (Cys-tRNA(Pro) deacylase)
MKCAEHRKALRIQGILGSNYEVLEFELPTRTVEEAAAAIGCEKAQIAKSLVFRLGSDQHVLVVASGINWVDTTKVAVIVGGKISRAEPEFVRERSGYIIGGVPPLGHRFVPVTLLDKNLTAFSEIWAAAGTPNAVFRLTPWDLRNLTGADFHDVARS